MYGNDVALDVDQVEVLDADAIAGVREDGQHALLELHLRRLEAFDEQEEQLSLFFFLSAVHDLGHVVLDVDVFVLVVLDPPQNASGVFFVEHGVVVDLAFDISSC